MWRVMCMWILLFKFLCRYFFSIFFSNKLPSNMLSPHKRNVNNWLDFLSRSWSQTRSLLVYFGSASCCCINFKVICYKNNLWLDSHNLYSNNWWNIYSHFTLKCTIHREAPALCISMNWSDLLTMCKNMHVYYML